MSSMIGRGGHRPGAGRKPGSKTKRTSEIALRAAAEGITPLEVMLTAMRKHAAAERWDEAAEIAAKAAPFMHARLASVDMALANQNIVYAVSDKPLSEEEWEAQFCQPTQ